MAAGKSNAEAMAAAGVVPKLQKLLSQESAGLLMAAARCLHMVCDRVPSAGLQAAQAATLARLLELTQSEAHATARADVVACLSSLAANEGSATALAEPSPVPALVYVLTAPSQSSREAQAHAMSALAALCQLPQHRTALALAQPAPLLVAVLAYPEDATRVAASRLIANACVDPALAADMFDAGVLSALQGVNVSLPLPSPFVSAAARQILNHHLSAKYALTGVLEVHDTITTTFYDPGCLKPGSMLPPLAEYEAQPVDARRPILLVKLARAKDAPAGSTDALLEALMLTTKARLEGLAEGDAVQQLAQCVAER
jgi:hypothetical protein